MAPGRLSYGQTTSRSGTFNRLAESAWQDPLDTAFSKAKGGRWNAPGSYGVLYLNNGEPMARAQVAHKLAGQPFTIEDLDPDEQHDLVEVTVQEATVLDCVTDAGLAAVGLPGTYPKDAAGGEVPHTTCQPIGQAAYDDGQDGVACRSAAAGTTRGDEELALFDNAAERLVHMTAGRPFSDWYLRRLSDRLSSCRSRRGCAARWMRGGRPRCRAGR